MCISLKKNFKVTSFPFSSGVYFEKVLKSSDTSLWVRNIQMYLSGIVVTLIGVYVTDGDKVLEKGFFFGYTPWVCFVVCEYAQRREHVSWLPSLFRLIWLFCSASSVQRRRPLHLCGGEIHGQHHEGLLCRCSHRSLDHRVCSAVRAADK